MAVNYIQSRRDKEITREIHRLFWRANLLDKPNLIIGYITRIIAFAAYHVVIPLMSAHAIQAIIERKFDKVSFYVWMVMLLSLVYGAGFMIGQFTISRNAVKALKYVQQTVFSNFLQKDYDFFSSAYIGTLGAQAARLRDAANSYGEIAIMLIPKQVTIIVASVVVISMQSVLLALITLISMCVVLAFTIISSSWRLKYRRKVSESSSQVAGQIGDALTHATAVKSFATEYYEVNRAQKSLEQWGADQYKSWMAGVPADTGRLILAAITTGLLLVLSARLYEKGTISITIVVLIQLYVIKLVAATLDIADIIKRYEEVMGAAYEPVNTMMLMPTVMDPDRPKTLTLDSTYTLEIKDMAYHYPDAAMGNNAIDGISLTIHKGEKIGLVGYSGSGKTTLTKLILRFTDVTDGSIELAGYNIRNFKQQDLRKLIAYVPQEPILFHRTIAENISYGKPGADRKAILKVAKQAYVDEFVKDLPKKYDTYVGERGIKLSGGQRQRVAIARALLKNAPILLLDEATSSLDSKSEKYIQEALWKLMKSRTALVIAHRLSTVQRMDRIVVLDKGKIAQIGTHDELKKKPGIYADLWSHQSGGYLGTNVEPK